MGGFRRRGRRLKRLALDSRKARFTFAGQLLLAVEVLMTVLAPVVEQPISIRLH
jgi:hypothetical protein